MLEQIKEAVAYIRSKCNLVPDVGIILGTGLDSLVKEIEIVAELHYWNIPHFPISTVTSHRGRLIFGRLSGKNVVVMQGRFHYYEGYSMQQVTFPVRVMKLLGIKHLLISNAAGGLHPDHRNSDLMIINDHINLQPENPLRGGNLDVFGVRFPDMSDAYDAGLIAKAREIGKRLNLRLHEGVYVSVAGPNLETRAEYRMLRILGGDAVGMSTVPEVIVARQMLLPVFAVSAITDECSEGNIQKTTLEDMISAAAKASDALIGLFKGLLEEI